MYAPFKRLKGTQPPPIPRLLAIVPPAARSHRASAGSAAASSAAPRCRRRGHGRDCAAVLSLAWFKGKNMKKPTTKGEDLAEFPTKIVMSYLKQICLGTTRKEHLQEIFNHTLEGSSWMCFASTSSWTHGWHFTSKNGPASGSWMNKGKMTWGMSISKNG